MTARRISGFAVFLVVALLVLPTPAQATFAGTNGKIAYSRNGDIFLVDPDGTDRVRLTEGRASDSSPAFSPDGRRVVFSRYRPMLGSQMLFVTSSDGSHPAHRITPSLRGFAIWPTWSPDGRWIAFEDLIEAPRGIGGALYVVRPNGNSLSRITGYWPRSFSPSWSPDSDRLVYASTGIHVTSLDGTDPTRLTTGETLEDQPRWSPIGDRILFTRTTPGPPGEGDRGSAIVSIAPDGTDEHILTDDADFCESPAWSPDGSRIAFLDFDPERGTDLWAMDADGSDLRPLTTGRSAGNGFVWSPDGTQIAYDDWANLRIVELLTGVTSRLTGWPWSEYLGDWQVITD
jgi:TolB protein